MKLFLREEVEVKMKMRTEAFVLGALGLPCLVALLRGPVGEWNPSIGSDGTCHM